MAYRKILTYQQVREIMQDNDMFSNNDVKEVSMIRVLELISANIPCQDLILYNNDEKVDILGGYEFISTLDYLNRNLKHCIKIYNSKKNKHFYLYEVTNMILNYTLQVIFLENPDEKNYYNIY